MHSTIRLYFLFFLARCLLQAFCARVRRPTWNDTLDVQDEFDVLMFEEPAIMKDAASLSGCEKGATYQVGKAVRTGATITKTECSKCRPGWLEKSVMVGLPPSMASLRVKGPQTMLKQICEWQPCGALCGTCSNLKRHYFGRREYFCEECMDSGYGKSTLVAEKITAIRQNTEDGDGKKVTITKTCTALAVTRSENRFVNAHSLMTSVLDMFMGAGQQLPRAEENPLTMLQAMQEFVGVCTTEFLATVGTEQDMLKLDMVGDGSKFMKKVVDDVIATAPFDQLVHIGQALVQSRMLADMRGALELCTQFAFARMPDDEHPDFARYRAATKGCDALENVIRLLLQSICDAIHCSKIRDATDFDGSLDHAPRRAYDVMRMFGLIEEVRNF